MPWFPPPDPVAVAQRRKLEQALDRAVPNWRGLLTAPGWAGWMVGTHLYSELSRQHHLDAAVARGDAHSVAEFFRDFLRTYPAVGRAPPPAGPAPDGKRIYTRPEILHLHEQHRKGAYKGREIEWARIENDIIRAGRENRIVGGIPLEKKSRFDGRR
jgi:hypothetical protein